MGNLAPIVAKWKARVITLVKGDFGCHSKARHLSQLKQWVIIRDRTCSLRLSINGLGVPVGGRQLRLSVVSASYSAR